MPRRALLRERLAPSWRIASMSGEELVEHRYAKFRQMGNFFA